MARVRITVAYDGRHLRGWQSQPGGATVQDALEGALATICKGTRVPVHGAGRTDAGVHAMAQVAHFDAPPEIAMAGGAWLRALNANLRAAIRVVEARVLPAGSDFHARFSATGKTYRYEIDRGAVLAPLRAGLAWHHPRALDVAVLRTAAAMIEGEHDFAAFAANRRDGKVVATTVRRIFSTSIDEQGATLAVTIIGNGFLYRMVRLLVGSIVRCAGGRDDLDWLRDLLDAPAGRTSSYAAPADGLYLVSVTYPAE